LSPAKARAGLRDALRDPKGGGVAHEVRTIREDRIPVWYSVYRSGIRSSRLPA
jgi:hypothetical protein